MTLPLFVHILKHCSVCQMGFILLYKLDRITGDFNYTRGVAFLRIAAYIENA
jgi:hypothetical protein